MKSLKAKIATVFSLLCLALSMTVFGVFSAQNYQNDTTGQLGYIDKTCYLQSSDGTIKDFYSTINKALASATDGDTICVFEDTALTENFRPTVNVTIKAVEKNVTVDVGEWCLTSAAEKIVNYGDQNYQEGDPTITFETYEEYTDSNTNILLQAHNRDTTTNIYKGVILKTNRRATINNGTATAIINIYGGEFYNSHSESGNDINWATVRAAYGTTHVYGGKFVAENVWSFYITGPTTIEDAEITSNGYNALMVTGSADNTIKNSKITGGLDGVAVTNYQGHVTIEGGEIIGKGATSAGLSFGHWSENTKFDEPHNLITLNGVSVKSNGRQAISSNSCVENCIVTISDCQLSVEESEVDVTGVYINGSSKYGSGKIIINKGTTISTSSTASEYGIRLFADIDAELDNITVSAKNYALFAEGNAEADISNCIFTSTGGNSSYGIYLLGNSLVSLSNSDSSGLCMLATNKVNLGENVNISRINMVASDINSDTANINLLSNFSTTAIIPLTISSPQAGQIVAHYENATTAQNFNSHFSHDYGLYLDDSNYLHIGTLVTAPTQPGQNSYTYTGSPITHVITSGLNTSAMTITQNTETNVGKYTATFALNGDKYLWADTSDRENKTFAWEIVAKPLTAPTNPVWSTGTNHNSAIATWSTVSNATGYTVELYSGSNKVGTYTTSIAQYDLTNYVSSASEGAYTFKVKATSTNANYAESAQATSSALYRLTFNSNYGTVTKTVQYYKSGDTISAPVYTRTGYTFSGWATSSGSTSAVTLTTATSTDEYYAIWTAVEYTITYNLDGGTVSGNPTTYTIETETITLKNPTKSGYTFTGWTGSNGETPQTTVTIAKGSTGNKSYTANWTAIEYTITYNLNGGTVSGNPTTYTIETETITLKNPTKSGYTFTGWTGSNGTTPQTTVKIAKGSTGNKSYTAKWTINSYTLTANANGGVIQKLSGWTGSGESATKQVTYNSTYGMLPQAPQVFRFGYTFDGWYTSLTGGTQVTSSTKYTIAGPSIIYARWTQNSYDITYDRASGSWASNYSPAGAYTYKTSGTTALPTSSNITRAGYTFNNWSLTYTFEVADWTEGFINLDTGVFGTNNTYPNSIYSTPIYLQAGTTYTVHNGVSGNIRWRIFSLDGVYQQKTLTETTYTADSNQIAYIMFHEGATDPQKQCTVTANKTITALPAHSLGNITLTAKWTINSYTLTANVNDGTFLSTTGWKGSGSAVTKTLTYGHAYGTLPTAYRENFTFGGWFTEQTGGTQVSASTTITGDTTIYAHWTSSAVYNTTKRVGYSSLATAISGANASGDKLVVLQNLTSTETYTVNKTLTILANSAVTVSGLIDVTSGTLTLGGGSNTLTIANAVTLNGGNLNVTDGTSITGANVTYSTTVTRHSGIGVLSENSTVTITGGSVYGTLYGIRLNGGKAIISGGTVSADMTDADANGIFVIDSVASLKISESAQVKGYNALNIRGDMAMTGGNVSGTNAGLYVQVNGVCSVTGGTITGNNGVYSVGTKTNSLTISGSASIKGTTNGINNTSSGTVTISGGTISGSSHSIVLASTSSKLKLSGKPTITGSVNLTASAQTASDTAIHVVGDFTPTSALQLDVNSPVAGQLVVIYDNATWATNCASDFSHSYGLHTEGTLTKIHIGTPVSKPTAGTNSFTYDGTQKTYTPSGYDSAKTSITGNTATKVGSYTATVSFKTDSANLKYLWSDGYNRNSFPLSWSITKASLSAPSGLTWTVTNNRTTVSASWSAVYGRASYTVVFKTNGTTKVTKTGLTGTSYTLSSTELGTLGTGTYTFTVQAIGDSNHNNSSVSSASGNLYKLTFNANYSGGATTTQYYKSGETISAPKLSRANYTLKGWATTSSATSANMPTTPSTSTTYYAVWTINSYTLTANANGGTISTTSGWTGSGTTATRQINHGQTYGTLPTVYRENYIFNGWYSSQTGGTQVNASTTITGNTTIYAHWTSATVYNITRHIGYSNLTSAIDDANAGDTLNILKNLTTSATYEVDKNITILTNQSSGVTVLGEFVLSGENIVGEGTLGGGSGTLTIDGTLKINPASAVGTGKIGTSYWTFGSNLVVRCDVSVTSNTTLLVAGANLTASTSYAINVLSGGEAIIASGNINASGSKIAIQNAGTLTITGGVIQGGTTAGVSKCIENTGNLKVSGGEVNGYFGIYNETSATASVSRNAYISGNCAIHSSGTLTISGGRVEGTGIGVENVSGGSKLTISGGSITGGTYGISNTDSTSKSLIYLLGVPTISSILTSAYDDYLRTSIIVQGKFNPSSPIKLVLSSTNINGYYVVQYTSSTYASSWTTDFTLANSSYALTLYHSKYLRIIVPVVINTTTNVQYADLQSAVDGADDGDTLIVINDTGTSDDVYRINKDLAILANSPVSITGNIEIDASNVNLGNGNGLLTIDGYITNSGGILTLQDNLEILGSTVGLSTYGVVNESNGQVNVDGATINKISNADYGIVNISNAVITSGISNSDNGELYISGENITINSTIQSSSSSDKALTILNTSLQSAISISGTGTSLIKGATMEFGALVNGIDIAGSATVNIENCTISKVSTFWGATIITISDNPTVSINGGTYSSSASNSDSQVISIGSGSSTVTIEGNAIIRGQTTTITTAISSASAGIQMGDNSGKLYVKSAEISGYIGISIGRGTSSVYIEGLDSKVNGEKYGIAIGSSYTGATGGYVEVSDGEIHGQYGIYDTIGSIVVTGGKISGDVYGVYGAGTKCSITGGTITSDTEGGVGAYIKAAEIEITDCDISGEKYGLQIGSAYNEARVSATITGGSYGLYNEGSYGVIIDGGEITSTNSGSSAIYHDGKSLTIESGEIIGVSYGIYFGSDYTNPTLKILGSSLNPYSISGELYDIYNKSTGRINVGAYIQSEGLTIYLNKIETTQTSSTAYIWIISAIRGGDLIVYAPVCTGAGGALVYHHYQTLSDGYEDNDHVRFYSYKSSTDKTFVEEDVWYVYDGSSYIAQAGCFDENTWVYYWDEKKKKIRRKRAKNVKFKDKLLVWNFDKGCFDFANPLFIQRTEYADEYTEIKFSDGSKLNVIQDHIAFNVDEMYFCPLCKDGFYGCPVGSRVMKYDGTFVTVVSKKVIHKRIAYTNIITKYHMNCFTNGILTSTAFNNIHRVGPDFKFIPDDNRCVNLSLLDGISQEYIDGLRLMERPDTVLMNSPTKSGCKSFKEYIEMKLGVQKDSD